MLFDLELVLVYDHLQLFVLLLYLLHRPLHILHLLLVLLDYLCFSLELIVLLERAQESKIRSRLPLRCDVDMPRQLG